MSTSKIDLDESWREVLEEEFSKPYMRSLKSFLKEELAKKKIIYPHGKDIFAAFKATPFDRVKVVIVGQDPYHGPSQAHGLSFSVKKGITPPPSLQNIFKELQLDLGEEHFKIPNHGNLLSWADQGVLLLNSTLTVEAHRAGSHQNKGWEIFTDRVIEILGEKRKGLVFLLWGSPAQKKCYKINPSRHLLLKSPHPSPLSAYRGFFNSHHFSQTNLYLIKNKQTPISWQIPS